MKKNVELKSLKGVEFFLGANKLVESLETGARQYGGATKFDNGIYSNYDNGKNSIEVDTKCNTLSIIIPSTIDVDKEIDNEKYAEYYRKIINNYFHSTRIDTYKSTGSWYSEDLNKVVIEKNAIITARVDREVTNNDIQFMLNLGKIVKKDMTQEAVSVLINEALCLV